MNLAKAQKLVNRGHALRNSGRLARAEAVFREAADLAPHHASPIHNLGVVLHQRGSYADAERALRRSLAIDPDRAMTRNALGAALVSQGRYAEGFPLYDAWREMAEHAGSKSPDLPFARWRGEDVAGKRLLVVSEEGLGDQIMYGRLVAALRGRGALVGWLSAPPLTRLFRDCLGIGAQDAVGDVKVEGFDFWCPSSALPVAFGLTPADVPSAAYLKAPPAVRQGGVRVGIATSGNPKNPTDHLRSLPAALAAELLALPGVTTLDPSVTGARDFYDTASIMAGLDLIVSVDSAPVHLAAALGRPTVAMLPATHTDWRWSNVDGGPPWYPDVKVIRQPGPGDWRAVVETVKELVA